VAGSGIGLAVVAQLVALHGGRAWAEAGPGKGARFVVELPVGADRERGTGNRGNGHGARGAETGDRQPASEQQAASVPGSQFPVPKQ